jgi:hypothetical protein
MIPILVAFLLHAAWQNVASEWDQYRLNDSQKQWYKSVRNKANVPCCNVADGHPTEQRRADDGHYQVPDPRPYRPGEWLNVPPEAMTTPANNPIGVATVWYVIQLEGQPDEKVYIRCFVPEAES